MNASWPFAQLTASRDRLSVSGRLIGSYDFSPDQVAGLEPYGVIPVLGRGLRIIHTVRDYPERIVFWCFGSPQRLIKRINDLGFRPRASTAQVPRRDGMAFRWSFLILAVILWNALLVLDGFVPGAHRKLPGAYTLLALFLVFVTALALNVSSRVQSWCLKPGRSIDEVRSMTLLALVVSGFLLVIMGVQYGMDLASRASGPGRLLGLFAFTFYDQRPDARRGESTGTLSPRVHVAAKYKIPM